MDARFVDIPNEIEINGTRFWLAEEVLEELAEQFDSTDAWLSNAGSAWPASTLMLLTRLQLDQMVEILRTELLFDVGTLSGQEVERGLRMMVEPTSDPGDGYVGLTEAAAIGEGFELWRALHASGSLIVSHALAVDGSVTLTVGPDIPGLETAGIAGGEGGELNASPAVLFGAASRFTEYAARFTALRNRRS